MAMFLSVIPGHGQSSACLHHIPISTYTETWMLPVVIDFDES